MRQELHNIHVLLALKLIALLQLSEYNVPMLLALCREVYVQPLQVLTKKHTRGNRGRAQSPADHFYNNCLQWALLVYTLV